MTLHELLEQFGLQEHYDVEQADTMQLRCRHCVDVVRAEGADLHLIECRRAPHA